MQHLVAPLSPGARCQLIKGPSRVGALRPGGAVQSAISPKDQTENGLRAAFATAELVDYFVSPFLARAGCQLEDFATILRRVATALELVARSAVEIAGCVSNKSDPWGAARFALELVNQAESPCVVGAGCHLEDVATSVGPSIRSHGIEVTLRIKDGLSPGLGSI